ncbi:MAG: histidine phosphatase family protein [Candidatus Heimdallarchaeaceae archaeon]
MEIYIVRHGETEFNVGEVRFRGRADIPLSEIGLKHAEETGQALSLVPLEKIYYSKLSRAKTTAAKIYEFQSKAEFIEEPLLFDLNFGRWEGKTHNEIFTEEEKKKWFRNPHDFIIPEGETFYQVLDRLHRLFLRLRKQKERNIALVSHGAVINLIFVYLTGTHPSHFWDFYVKPCSISHITLREDGNFKINILNDTNHLS